MSAAGGPKSDGGLEPTGGVRSSDGGAPRLVGALALGTLELEVESPAMVLPAKTHDPELGSVAVVVAVPLKEQVAPVLALFW